jgi:hypothetical protein
MKAYGGVDVEIHIRLCYEKTKQQHNINSRVYDLMREIWRDYYSPIYSSKHLITEKRGSMKWASD